LWSEELNLYLGIHEQQLRYFSPEGSLVLTPAEANIQERQRAEQEHQRAEQERQRTEQERQRADRLAAQLKGLGVNPETEKL
jgi:hypothetical protein